MATLLGDLQQRRPGIGEVGRCECRGTCRWPCASPARFSARRIHMRRIFGVTLLAFVSEEDASRAS